MIISVLPSRFTSTKTGVDLAALVSPSSTCQERAASSPAKSDNFVVDVEVLSCRITAKRAEGVQRSIAPGLTVRLPEKFPIIEPYASEPMPSSSATQLRTGSSMLRTFPDVALWMGIEPLRVAPPPYCPHGWPRSSHG